MSLTSIWFLGLFLGMRHATEADHLAAVASLATRSGSRMQTLRLGAVWGPDTPQRCCCSGAPA